MRVFSKSLLPRVLNAFLAVAVSFMLSSVIADALREIAEGGEQATPGAIEGC